mgnify:CR=1 FL=1
MKPCFIKVSSKNRNSILKFSFLIFKKLNFKIGSKVLLKNYVNAQKKRKIFTILKSPHVNKKAQEQFEIKLFSQKLIICTVYDVRFVYFLKNVKLRLFPDIKLKVEFSVNNKNYFKTQVFNPYNYKFQSYSFFLNQKTIFKHKKKNIQRMKYINNLAQNLKKSATYLNILGIYGELFLEKSLDSSVGRAKD